MAIKAPTYKSFSQIAIAFILTAFGSLLTAISLESFLIPNNIIDGGIIGIAMMTAQLFGPKLLPLFYIAFNLPFIYMAYKGLGKTFVIQMILASLMFTGWLSMLSHWHFFVFQGETIEIIVVGGLLLGIGIGTIIRAGGCLDGTEILAIMINKRLGFTVGQTILGCNIVIFAFSGLVFGDWHPPIFSFMTFLVAAQMMDKVIVGFDEMKSVTIMSAKPKEVADAIVHELGLGLTIMHGRGGFSGKEQEVLYVITERLQLGALKELVYATDACAFMTVETLHEVSYGTQRPDIAAPRKQRKKQS